MGEKLTENDRCLIEACLQRNIEAWSRLIKKYSGLVYIAVENRLKKYNITASSHDIEDIKQNIFTDIWKNNKLEHVVNRDDISHWIAILSGNAAIEHFRTGPVRQAQRTVSLFHKLDEGELCELLPSGAADPKDELARAEIEDKIDEAIGALVGREKVMIKLHLIHDKKYHEIAEFLGVPKGTVSSCIKRAKEKLRKKLQQF
jgi:RNA polymerase sigma factor (sigma-70 family)